VTPGGDTEPARGEAPAARGESARGARGGPAPGARGESARERAAVSRFVESFASAFVDAGVPRMPSRVFAAILASDAGRLTAAELSEQLRISPAAVSGAVRYLAQVDLVVRAREPGSRRDVYAVRDDAWYEAIVRRERLLDVWARAAREGVDALGRDTPAGARLAETLAFFEFLKAEMPALLERWRASRPQR
jgi:predicted transcriptional regulator